MRTRWKIPKNFSPDVGTKKKRWNERLPLMQIQFIQIECFGQNLWWVITIWIMILWISCTRRLGALFVASAMGCVWAPGSFGGVHVFYSASILPMNLFSLRPATLGHMRAVLSCRSITCEIYACHERIDCKRAPFVRARRRECNAFMWKICSTIFRGREIFPTYRTGLSGKRLLNRTTYLMTRKERAMDANTSHLHFVKSSRLPHETFTSPSDCTHTHTC